MRYTNLNLKTLDYFQFKDKLVLLRIDINSPSVKGKILDNPRFEQSGSTIKEILSKNAKLVIIAHQGRKGKSDFLSLKQHAQILSKHLGRKIRYIPDLLGKKASLAINSLQNKEAILLENVRFYNEDADNSSFYKFSRLFDLFVNDSFSVSHRNQASIVIPPKVIPSCVGRAFEKEINSLKRLNLSGKKGSYLIGGAKIEDYLPLFNLLKNKNSKILASGVLANLILVSKGINLGYENKWLKKNKYTRLTPKLKEIYKKYKFQIILPIDFALGSLDKKEKRREISIKKAPFNEKILDIGHNSVDLFKKEIRNSNLIFMKGPLGFSEIQEYSYATREILSFISRMSEKGAFSILGGGHLSSTIQKYKIPDNFSYISSSGGALIAFISGERLPGIEALESGVSQGQKNLWNQLQGNIAANISVLFQL